jgi:serine/threonine-protein kinase ULK2
MAPEILRYERYDAKADLWSVGAVLYEMAVGRPPFRAQNHIELGKKIEQTRTIKFPDEDPVALSKPGGEDIVPVPTDVKQLIRGLLRKVPAERFSFDDFFKSTAMARSKFPRPAPSTTPSATASVTDAGLPTPVQEHPAEQLVWPPAPAQQSDKMPDAHRVIPSEVLDDNAIIPPSKIHFRPRDSEGKIAPVDNALLTPTKPRTSPRTTYVYCMKTDRIPLLTPKHFQSSVITSVSPL